MIFPSTLAVTTDNTGVATGVVGRISSLHPLVHQKKRRGRVGFLLGGWVVVLFEEGGGRRVVCLRGAIGDYGSSSVEGVGRGRVGGALDARHLSKEMVYW